MRATLPITWVWLVLLSAVSFAGPLETVSVQVTAAAAENVYLDKGRDAGIQIGDTVILYPVGGGTVQGSIVSVSKSSSRAQIFDGSVQIQVGTRGEVQTQPPPAESPAPAPPAPKPQADEKKAPEHPPWTQPPKEWDENMPLLAPAFGRDPKEREMSVRGRIFLNTIGTWDREFTNNRFFVGRVGTELWVDNAFHDDGHFHIRGEFIRRESLLSGSNDDRDDLERLDRLSYYQGGNQKSSYRWEAGRFLQHSFPELGLLDGFELNSQSEGGDVFGFSVGAVPEPFLKMKTGDDLQIAGFTRIYSGEKREFSLGMAAQHSWHEGEADRDLLLGTLDYHPDWGLFLNGSIWADYYTNSDSLKDPGFEISEAHALAGYRFTPQNGFGVFYNQFRFPELLRNEFDPITAQQIADNHNQRYGGYTWQEFWDVLRLDGRCETWSDQDDRGNNWDGRFGLRNWLYSQGEVFFGYFQTKGSFTDGSGIRAGLSKFYGFGSATLSYERAKYEFFGDDEEQIQHSIRGNVDCSLGKGWSGSLFGDHRSGDNVDSLTVGLYLQKSF